MVISFETLSGAYLATDSSLRPNERFAIVARQLEIEDEDARKNARRRLARAEVIPPSKHGGKRNSLKPEEERKIVDEFNNYISCVDQIFLQTRVYASPIPWIAEGTGYSTTAVKRVLRDELGEDGLEIKIEGLEQRYRKFKIKLLTDTHKKYRGDPRAACREAKYSNYKHLAADWRRMGLAVKVDYRTVKARRNRIDKMSIALTAVDKENATHSLFVR